MAKKKTIEERSVDAGPRTRGGWAPAGTAAERRANHSVNGTSRGRRSRQRLIDAARKVFERIGYFEATIDDIITEAGVARGSFYTYFPDKLSIFQTVAIEVNADMRTSVGRDSVAANSNPIERLDAANRSFIDTYRRHAQIYGLVEQVATVDPTIHADRLQTRKENVARVSGTIRGWQERGLADPEVDADTAASLLVSMTSNFCYWWFVGGEEQDESAIGEVTATWVRVTGLRKRPRPAWVKAQEEKTAGK